MNPIEEFFTWHALRRTRKLATIRPIPPRSSGSALHLQLRPPNAAKKVDTCLALDPCCGQGVAIQALTAALGIPEEQVYTVELDGERSTAAQALMPRHHHLGPAGFAGTQITSASFGLVYLNPPFGSELCARQRQEVTFTEIATRKLVPKGILTLVCPFKALHGNKEFCELIDANYEDVCVYKFPDGEDAVGNAIRPYHEITVIGKKRSAGASQGSGGNARRPPPDDDAVEVQHHPGFTPGTGNRPAVVLVQRHAFFQE